MTNRQQPNWRSLLFVPVTAERFVAKAHTRGADAIMVAADVDPEQARMVVEAIARGKIPNVSISY